MPQTTMARLAIDLVVPSFPASLIIALFPSLFLTSIKKRDYPVDESAQSGAFCFSSEVIKTGVIL